MTSFVAVPQHLAVLDNGLKVVISPDPGSPDVTVAVGVGVGARHERPGERGLAHLFEHLMFLGSENMTADDLSRTVESHGGSLNARTTCDDTVYHETVPVHVLDEVLWMEADRFATAGAHLHQALVDNERAVVDQERRETIEGPPFGDLFERLLDGAFPADHPYRLSPMGDMEQLAALSLQEVKDFFDRHYTPANCVLTVVGDVRPEQVIASADKYFGDWQSHEQPRSLPDCPALPPLRGAATTTVHADLPHDALVLGLRLPALATPLAPVASVALACLASGTTGRLVRDLVHTGLAFEASCENPGLHQGTSIALTMISCEPGSELDRVRAVVDQHLADLGHRGPGDAELAVARGQLARASADQVVSQVGRADLLSSSTLGTGHPLSTLLGDCRAETVTADEVRAFADVWLQPEAVLEIRYRAQEATR